MTGMEDIQPLANDILHLLAGVQAGHGILEDHLHFGAQHFMGIGAELAADLAAVKGDFAARRIIQADDAAADGGFARAGLAHQAVGFAGIHLEGYAVDGLDGKLPGNGKMLFEVFHLQQRFAHRYFSASFRARARRACSSLGISTLGASGCSNQVAA